jgi:hypothetical protein
MTPTPISSSLLPFRAPQQLTELPQWVLWRSHEGRKCPFQINGRFAKTTDPSTWAAYDPVLREWQAHPDRWSGIGYVFADEDPYAGIDLDDCLTNLTPKPWARPIIERLCNTYLEISPSGNGLKAFVIGTPATEARFQLGDGSVEIYSKARYFTVTGRAFEDAPLVLEEQNDTLAWLLAEAPRGNSVPFQLPARIPYGTRHHALTSLAGTVALRGCSVNNILALLVSIRDERLDGPYVSNEHLLKVAQDAVRWAAQKHARKPPRLRLAGQPEEEPNSDLHAG